MNSKILLSHAFGNQNTRNAAKAFYDNDTLAKFVTSIGWDENHILNSFLPKKIHSILSKRAFTSYIPQNITVQYPVMETLRHTLGLNFKIFSDSFSSYNVIKYIDQKVASLIRDGFDADTVYGYEFGCLKQFTEAKLRGIRTIYELPIGYYRYFDNLIQEELEQNCDWIDVKSLSENNEIQNRTDPELNMADLIIVPSQYVKDTLALSSVDTNKIHIIPYGMPNPVNSNIRNWTNSGKIKCIYVGGLTQRKGISYLSVVAKKVSSLISLDIIGSQSTLPTIKKFVGEHNYLGTLPHTQVLEQMRTHDIMIFPTLHEGCCLAVLEAMSQGLVVITTPNSGASDIIKNGVNGYIVPIRDVDTVSGIVENLYQNRDLLRIIGQNAIETASICDWENYRKTLLETVNK